MDSECVRPFPGIRPFLGGIFGPKMIVALEQVTALRIEFDWLDDKIIRTTTTTTTTTRIRLIVFVVVVVAVSFSLTVFVM